MQGFPIGHPAASLFLKLETAYSLNAFRNHLARVFTVLLQSRFRKPVTSSRWYLRVTERRVATPPPGACASNSKGYCLSRLRQATSPPDSPQRVLGCKDADLPTALLTAVPQRLEECPDSNPGDRLGAPYTRSDSGAASCRGQGKCDGSCLQASAGSPFTKGVYTIPLTWAPLVLPQRQCQGPMAPYFTGQKLAGLGLGSGLFHSTGPSSYP